MTILILILFAVAAFVAVPAVGPIGIVAGAIPTLALIALVATALRHPGPEPRAAPEVIERDEADELAARAHEVAS